MVNYPSLYIHNFLLNKYANAASPAAFARVYPGDIHLWLGPLGGDRLARWARAGPASPLLPPHFLRRPGPQGLPSELSSAHLRAAGCVFFVPLLSARLLFPLPGPGTRRAPSLVLASVSFSSLSPCPPPSRLPCLSCPDLQPNLPCLRTFALAVSQLGMFPRPALVFQA